MLRGPELSSWTDSNTFQKLEDAYGAGNVLEYSFPLYSVFGVGRYAGLGCSLVRALKIPSNVASISHDSSVGAEPHNYFSLAFNGATFEQRTPALFDSGRFVAQQIYVMRYPILQTVWGEKGLGRISQDEIRLQVCACARVLRQSLLCRLEVACCLAAIGRQPPARGHRPKEVPGVLQGLRRKQ